MVYFVGCSIKTTEKKPKQLFYANMAFGNSLNKS